MSNHVTATESKIILIKYADGVKTLVNCQDWDAKYIAHQIIEISNSYKHDTVWYIDSMLNDYNLSQCMLSQDCIIVGAEEVVITERPYTLGENETEKDVQKYYPNWKEINNKTLEANQNEK